LKDKKPDWVLQAELVVTVGDTAGVIFTPVNPGTYENLYNGMINNGFWMKLSLPSIPHAITVIIKNKKIFTIGGGYDELAIDLGPIHYGGFYLYSPDHLFTGWNSQMVFQQIITGWGIYDIIMAQRLKYYAKKITRITPDKYLQIGDKMYSTLANFFFGTNCASIANYLTGGRESVCAALPSDKVGLDVDILKKVLVQKKLDGATFTAEEDERESIEEAYFRDETSKPMELVYVEPSPSDDDMVVENMGGGHQGPLIKKRSLKKKSKTKTKNKKQTKKQKIKIK